MNFDYREFAHSELAVDPFRRVIEKFFPPVGGALGPGITSFSTFDLVCVKFQGESILGLTKISSSSRTLLGGRLCFNWRFQSFKPFNRCAPFKSFRIFRTRRRPTILRRALYSCQSLIWRADNPLGEESILGIRPQRIAGAAPAAGESLARTLYSTRSRMSRNAVGCERFAIVAHLN